MKEDDVLRKIKEEEEKQALSIPAKRLREKLLPLKSKEEQTARRWFWELLQNASDYNQTVDVLLEVDDDKVIFKHNGRPFSIQDVLNLISPDSGKDKDEIKKDNIGKFGSGLVSTHILSSEIEVKGVFITNENTKKLYKFNILLDRNSYENKEKLIESIEATKKSFRENYSEIDKAEYSGFMTSFSYNLNKILPELSNSMDVVKIGLEYIYKVLPYTLCFMTKVKSVNIIDKRKKPYINNYSIVNKTTNETTPKFEISQNGQISIIEFTKLKHKQVETVYQNVNGEVIPLPKGISKLFCGLPMIGSENIGLPFILNSFDFEPTLEREGIEITPNDKQNTALFKQAIELYQNLLDDVSNKRLERAYNLTRLSKKYNGVEGSKNIFRRDFVPEFKRIIEKSVIVKNSLSEFIPFSDILLPYKDGSPFFDLYEQAVEIKQNFFPVNNSFEGWVNATDFTLFSKQKYDLKQFVSEISQTTHITAFVLYSNTTVIDWLKKVASLVNEEDETLFSNYAILPNQNGELKKKNELYVDNDIPKELKKIYNRLSAEEIEIKLLDKTFNDFSNIIDKSVDINEICKRIDELIKKKYTEDKASTANFILPLNDLFNLINNCSKSKKELENLFPWFYPRRANLFMDSFGATERDYAFTIVQSGKIKALATLAQSGITAEELEYISNNPKIMSKFYELLQTEINDKKNANSETGDFGEDLVYYDLRRKYKKSDGYEIIWASKEGEPRFDFEVKLNGKTVFFVDAKTTMRGISNSDSIPFFMRSSQWEFLPKIEKDVKYLIARVFKNEEIIKYLQISIIN